MGEQIVSLKNTTMGITKLLQKNDAPAQIP